MQWASLHSTWTSCKGNQQVMRSNEFHYRLTKQTHYVRFTSALSSTCHWQRCTSVWLCYWKAQRHQLFCSYSLCILQVTKAPHPLNSLCLITPSKTLIPLRSFESILYNLWQLIAFISQQEGASAPRASGTKPCWRSHLQTSVWAGLILDDTKHYRLQIFTSH